MRGDVSFRVVILRSDGNFYVPLSADSTIPQRRRRCRSRRRRRRRRRRRLDGVPSRATERGGGHHERRRHGGFLRIDTRYVEPSVSACRRVRAGEWSLDETQRGATSASRIIRTQNDKRGERFFGTTWGFFFSSRNRHKIKRANNRKAKGQTRGGGEKVCSVAPSPPRFARRFEAFIMRMLHR